MYQVIYTKLCQSGLLFFVQLSKAAMLHKGADYIRQLNYERGQLKEEMEMLRQQIDGLNQQIRYFLLAKDSMKSQLFDYFMKLKTFPNKITIFTFSPIPHFRVVNFYISKSLEAHRLCIQHLVEFDPKI